MSEYKWKYSLFACARWENDYIVEWIAYHRSIGIDHIYLYCNDDDPTELYVKVESFNAPNAPFVTFIHYPWQGQQYYMYVHALRKFKTETEWLMFLDVDEFLVLKDYNNIELFMQSIKFDFDCIYFNWLVFGNNNFKRRPKGNVLPQYTRREANLNPNTKHFTRTKQINMSLFCIGRNIPFWHNWRDLLYDGSKLINVIGYDMSNYYNNFPTQAKLYLADHDVNKNIINVGVIHHYALKAESDTSFRLSRGTGGQFGGQYIWENLKKSTSWIQHLEDTNSVEDLTLADYWQTFMKLRITIIDLSNCSPG